MNLSHPGNCITHSLMRAARRLSAGFEIAAAETGVTAAQFTTLAMLSGYGVMTVGQMASEIATDRTTLTRNLNVMAARGWIKKSKADDRRKHAWVLADAGKRVLNEVFPIWQDWQARLVADFGEETSLFLLQSLRSLDAQKPAREKGVSTP